MGCFLACFGFPSKKRRRRKPILSGDHIGHGRYQPLEGILLDQEGAESSAPSPSVLSGGKQSSVKTRKKVRFNLNVQAYEPISKVEDDSDVEEHKSECADDESKLAPSPTSQDGDSIALTMGLHRPLQNHRYQNCRDSSDEEDELVYEDSDFELEDDDDDSGSDDDSYGYIGSLNSGTSPQPNHLSCTSSIKEETSLIRLDESQTLAPGPATRVRELNTRNPNQNARCRTRNFDSVLNPVENSMQWKMIKAKAAPAKHRRKENMPLEQLPSIPSSSIIPLSQPDASLGPKPIVSSPPPVDRVVNTSLSNWLLSSNSDPPEKASISKNGPSFSGPYRFGKTCFDEHLFRDQQMGTA